MHAVNDVTVSPGAIDLPDRLLELRESVFRRWRECVQLAIPEARGLDDRTLTTALSRFFDDLVDALKTGHVYSVEVPGLGSSFSHGRERATSTQYGARELLQELQLFRQALFEVADDHKLILEHRHRSLIGRSIDCATLDAINAFAIAQREVSETFILSLSHDLRNPLNVANASAQLIQLKSADAGVLTLTQRIRTKLHDIDAMIGTLLDAAFLKGRKKLRLNIVQFDMKELVDEVRIDMNSPDRPIISTGESVLGYWCFHSMKRVFENLISNAQKYGRANTPISVHVERVDNLVAVEVHNEGSPIPEHERHLLFSTFHRFEDVCVTGWGLGLPFVRLVTESHGGAITVNSTELDGTTFRISMPVDCRSYVSAS